LRSSLGAATSGSGIKFGAGSAAIGMGGDGVSAGA
jgi:hypothetical protein